MKSWHVLTRASERLGLDVALSKDVMKVYDDLKALRAAIDKKVESENRKRTKSRFDTRWDIVDRFFKVLGWTAIIAVLIRGTLFLATRSAFAVVGAVLILVLFGLVFWVVFSPIEGIFGGLSQNEYYTVRSWQRRLLVCGLTGFLIIIVIAVIWFWAVILLALVNLKS